MRVLRLDGYAPSRRILLARLAPRVPTPAEEAMTDVILQVGRTVPGASGPRGETGQR
ncbi:hypothetical protein [Streptomyces sp. RKND-216]|uniref:hypothetical protein n=1 Tax=Streptomyces sp. RKND-216 TaxID=2562581 RepID=UPI001B352CBD|nr:hypothetical protein [Streptomyces sp. RKND-216]